MSNRMKERPSKIISLNSDYESFCFDEACVYILNKLQEEDAPSPKFHEDLEAKRNKKNNNDVIEWLKANNKNC